MKLNDNFTLLLNGLVLLTIVVICSTKTVSAAEFNMDISGTTVIIPKDIINSWTGKFTVTQNPIFTGKNKTKLVEYNPSKIYNWVKTLNEQINREPVEGELKIENNRATAFTPPVTGQRLDTVATTWAILRALQEYSNNVQAVIYKINPQATFNTANSLGITELVGHGESVFKGSPKNRRHNIAVGVEKLKGLILSPGQEFSFDEYICPVDKQGGYLPELVIKAEGTIPEYGGGLCQVSSTIFRASMDAGLSIVQRKNHSYAVQYYAPQGTDATTYCGGVDFKFKNDMTTSVLIWPYFANGDKLVFDIYGTKDGRKVVLDKPVQFDKKPDGSMKATWTRHITKNGNTTDEVFKSTYLPPALFHKQEKLDSPNPSPTPTTSPTPSSQISPPENISPTF